jgi:hypothetical protein
MYRGRANGGTVISYRTHRHDVKGTACVRTMVCAILLAAILALPAAAQEDRDDEGEGLGTATMAVMILASVILPYNLFVKAMRKGGLEFLGLDREQFNKIAGSLRKLMTGVHYIFGALVLAVATWHTLSAMGVVSYKLLHYSALAGLYALAATGVIARYVPMPGKAKRPLRTFHIYVLFAIVVALLALAHIFIGD